MRPSHGFDQARHDPERSRTGHRFWRGRRVVVTAGPTREPLDPVRFLTNASSGRMGYALAAEARRLGARVTLVTGPTSLAAPRGVRVRRVVTAREMFRAALREGLSSDAVIGAAAVADWRPRSVSRRKKKKGSARTSVLFLSRNPDILAALSRRRKGARPRLAGFALETENARRNALKKLREKSLDLIVANAPDALERSGTRARILTRSGRSIPFRGPKTALARIILSALAHEMAPSPARGES